MKFLLTGAAGFIGSHVTEKLLDRGDSVVGIDNFNDFYSPAIKRRNAEELGRRTGFRLAEADIEDRAAVDEIFAAGSFDAVIHLAARAGVRPSITHPELYERTNGLGTLNLLEAARLTGVVKIVLASSSSVYGTNSKLPFSENDPVDQPVSPYAATKRANELMAHTYHSVHKLHIYCLRYFTVYGPRQRPEMAIAKFLRLVDEGQPVPFHGDGSSRRDYTYIDDIAGGTVAALDTCIRRGGFEIVNLGGHGTTTLAELIGLVEKTVGKPALLQNLPDQPGDVPATYADITKARSLLGWGPATAPSEGIPKQYEWWRRTRA